MANPYIVRSTRGFLWLTNNALSGVNLASKYIEFDCDIYLNDETFDENGVPRGGDGVVDEWKPISGATYSSWEGNGHIVYNCYINNPEKEYLSFFGGAVITKVNNVIQDGFFISGNRLLNHFGHNIRYISNCISKNGNLINKGGYVSIFVNVSKKIENCKNYSNIISSGWVCGAFFANWDSKAVLTIENCENYGNVTGIRYIGGISGAPSAQLTIINCKNYGAITSNETCGGGISAAAYAGYQNISNCENYGTISVKDYRAGGIISFASTRLDISYCKNYGSVSGNGETGGVIGYVFVYQEPIVNISNCLCQIDVSKSKGSLILGTVGYRGHFSTIKLHNIKVIAYNVSRDISAIGYIYDGDVDISNIEIGVDATKNTYKSNYKFME